MAGQARDARGAALQVLRAVLGQRRSLNDALEEPLAGLPDRRERALAQTLCYSVLRFLPRLRACLKPLLRKPLKAKDLDVEILLLLGLVQILELRIPEHAAVGATVNLARKLGKPWAGGLINGVLRSFLRRQEEILAEVDKQPSARWAHPDWLLQRLRRDWPRDWEAICAANNQQAPMHLRVNQRQTTAADYLAELNAAALDAVATPHVGQGLTLAQACDVSRLPGFDTGRVSVQDPAAQLAAELLAPPSGARVLDACAAPGGKTAHLLEQQPDIALWAVEQDPARLDSLRATLQRLQLSAALHCADAGQPQDWWDGQPFSHILLDAPCSASGVIRRHPDIKYLRRDNDIAALAATQRHLLEALWPLLAPGGTLLYATCSVFAAENFQQLESFLAAHTEAKEQHIVADWGRPCLVGRQILPGEDQMDGFYYARLQKTR